MGSSSRGVSRSFLEKLAGYSFEKPGESKPPVSRSPSRSSSRSPSPKKKSRARSKSPASSASSRSASPAPARPRRSRSESPETLRRAILARMASREADKKQARSAGGGRSPSGSD
ncbi:serine/arginine repetitive matrix protein 5-like [Pollicipes pollicipes]|uniref:serine/arginine repetitive matrix protein 5-like n=1 Tax=Pollicipes pollicipes TaxID=41117 RepID=UPI001885A10E|nr:serine/arginine repetitive matrix protein 5-like [Pollicipes pollicipes]